MDNPTELTYHEYFLTKRSWDAEFAIQLIVDYAKFTRAWELSDNFSTFVSGMRSKIISQISEDKAWHIFTVKAVNPAGFDRFTGEFIEEQLCIERSIVDPKEFIRWAHSKGYQMPYEFKCFIGVEEKEEKMTEKTEERIDRAVCQGIGRTLWDIYPNMTIEEMQYLKAIQVYGGGKGYTGEGTLRRWLRVYDPRKVKTGPKTKP